MEDSPGEDCRMEPEWKLNGSLRYAIGKVKGETWAERWVWHGCWDSLMAAYQEPPRQPALSCIFSPASDGHPKKVHPGLDLLGQHLAAADDAKPSGLGGLQQGCDMGFG
jgi:hypothetical protein